MSIKINYFFMFLVFIYYCHCSSIVRRWFMIFLYTCKCLKRSNDKLWCYKKSNNSPNSESSPLFFAKCHGRATTRTWAISNFRMLLKIGNYFCVLAVYYDFVLSRRFAKAFCQAGEVDMQNYAPAQNILTGNKAVDI